MCWFIGCILPLVMQLRNLGRYTDFFFLFFLSCKLPNSGTILKDVDDSLWPPWLQVWNKVKRVQLLFARLQEKWNLRPFWTNSDLLCQMYRFQHLRNSWLPVIFLLYSVLSIKERGQNSIHTVAVLCGKKSCWRERNGWATSRQTVWCNGGMH